MYMLNSYAMVAVDGKWGSWSKWSKCSKICGGGKKERKRKCDNPKPEHGGKNCAGNDEEEKTCNTQLCTGVFISSETFF